MARYSHVVAVAFTIVNDREDGNTMSDRELMTGLATRLASLIAEPDIEAFDIYDTVEVDEEFNENTEATAVADKE
jgi:hypothetical protein